MAYGQKNYLQTQGINGKYRISQIGCFLTAFSNLTERFGRPVDPISLNAIFRDRQIYIDVDDKIRDDLYWSAITKYDGNIRVTGTGSGRPPHSNAIVKFSGLSSRFGTHFCLVADAKNGSIVDSWDGQVKSWDAYGGPKAWATYQDFTPRPTPAPQPSDPNVITVIMGQGWGISHALKSIGYSREQFSNPKEWDRVATLNGKSAFNPGDKIKLYKAPLQVSAPPAPAPQPQPGIVTIIAQNGWGISHILKAAGYSKDDYSDAYQWVKFSELNGAPQGQNLRITPGTAYRVHQTPYEKPKPIAVQAPDAPPPEEPKPEVAPTTPQPSKVEQSPVTVADGKVDYPVGPLEDDDSLFDLSVAKEARILAGKLTARERFINIIASIEGFFIRALNKVKIKRS